MVVLAIIEIMISIAIFAILVNGIEDYRSRKSLANSTIFELEKVNSFDIPLIKVTQNDKEFYFIVDTGANNSSINSKDCEDFEYEITNDTGNAYGIEGNVVKITYGIASFCIRNIEFKEQFQMLDLSKGFENCSKDYGIHIKGILGSNFLKRYGLSIDLYHNIIYSV